VISNHIINGELANPYIKDVIGLSNAFSCKGPCDDYIDGLSRLVNLFKNGANIEELIQHKRLMFFKISDMYSCRKGQANNPTDYIKEVYDVNIPQHLIPLTLFGVPGLTIRELIACGPSCDDLVKIRYVLNTVEGNENAENKLKNEILTKMWLFCTNIASVGNDYLSVTSRVSGSLKYNITINSKDGSIKRFQERLSDVESGKSFPLFLPNKSNIRMLEYLKDQSLKESYKAALGNTSEDISSRRRLAMMVTSKSLRYTLTDKNKNLNEKIEEATDRQQLIKNKVRDDVYYFKTILVQVINGEWKKGQEHLIKYKNISDLTALINEFKVYNSLVDIVGSYTITGFLDVKRPARGVNRIDKLTVAIADAGTVVKALTSIFNPELCLEEFGTLSGEEVVVKNYIEDRFGDLIQKTENNIMAANRIAKIIKDEGMKSTPYIQPYIKTRSFVGFIKGMFKYSTYANKTCNVISNARYEARNNLITISNDIIALTQCKIMCKLNRWEMLYDLNAVPTVEELTNMAIKSDNRSKGVLAVFEKLFHDSSFIFREIYKDNDLISHTFLGSKRVMKEGKYYGRMSMKMQRNNEVCIVTRIDGEGDEKSGLVSIESNTRVVRDIIKFLKYYVQYTYNETPLKHKMLLNHRGFKRINNFKINSNCFYIKEWEVDNFTIIKNPPSTEMSCIEVNYNPKMYVERSEARADLREWKIDMDSLRIVPPRGNDKALPRLDNSVDYNKMEIVVAYETGVLKFSSPNDVKALIENTPEDLSSRKYGDVVNLITINKRRAVKEKVIKMFKSSVSDNNSMFEIGGNTFKQGFKSKWTSNYHSYKDLLVEICSGRNGRVINFDNFCQGFISKKSVMNSKDFNNEEHWEKISRNQLGFEILSAIFLGKFVSSIYRPIKTEEGFSVLKADPTKDSKILLNRFAASSIEYKAGECRESTQKEVFEIGEMFENVTGKDVFDCEGIEEVELVDSFEAETSIINSEDDYGEYFDWNDE